VLLLAGGGLAVAISTSGSTSSSTAGSSGSSAAGSAPTSAGGPATTSASSASAGTAGDPDPTGASTPAAPLTAAAAGDLAAVDLPPGDDGYTASLTFPGVVLEPRAVGVTVAYPVLTVDSDGTSTIAHLDLPIWNCLAGTPPVDPAAAQCSRALEEHADLGSPDLVTERDGDGADLSGSFATYTRPNGSAPAYTGRSYPLTVTITDQAGPGQAVSGALTLGGTRVDASGEGSFSG
jgi:hypothetical protein